MGFEDIVSRWTLTRSVMDTSAKGRKVIRRRSYLITEQQLGCHATWHWNAGAEETGDPRENPPTSGMARYDSHLGSPSVVDRPIMNAVMYLVVFGVVCTNRTTVSCNTATNRTGGLAVVDIGDPHIICRKCHAVLVPNVLLAASEQHAAVLSMSASTVHKLEEQKLEQIRFLTGKTRKTPEADTLPLTLSSGAISGQREWSLRTASMGMKSLVGILPDDYDGWRGFLGDLPFPQPLHSGASPHSPRFALIGSEDLYLKSNPNLCTPLYYVMTRCHYTGTDKNTKTYDVSNTWCVVESYAGITIARQMRREGRNGTTKIRVNCNSFVLESVIRRVRAALIACGEAKAGRVTSLPPSPATRGKELRRGWFGDEAGRRGWVEVKWCQRGGRREGRYRRCRAIRQSGALGRYLHPPRIDRSLAPPLFREVGNAARWRALFKNTLPPSAACHSATRCGSRRLHVDWQDIAVVISVPARATVAERLARSPPTNANRAQSPAGSPDFSKWESCQAIPLVSGFSRGSPASPLPSQFRHHHIFTSITLIVSEVLDPVHLPPGRTSFNLQPGHSRIFASGEHAGRCRWLAGFLRDLPFTPRFHSGTASGFWGSRDKGQWLTGTGFQDGRRPESGAPRTSALGQLVGSTVAERLARSPPTKANGVQSPAGSPDSRKWESGRTMLLVGGSSRGSPISDAPSFRCRSIFTSFSLIGSQDLAVKSHPNLFTHSSTSF
ncbi:hypothetical protein PR048_022347 [Dryococelus australis]|uniref:Uncharacterized protein n=1 Tax=Dryococelus australis TaxID=614101 RepID=A0ABQ9H0R8_9NEOP|nr:hypothetical protein PR048_022347 [Dryococelus australis]